mgnify:CR=1 FL=1
MAHLQEGAVTKIKEIFINNKKTCENVWNFEKKALTL